LESLDQLRRQRRVRHAIRAVRVCVRIAGYGQLEWAVLKIHTSPRWLSSENRQGLDTDRAQRFPHGTQLDEMTSAETAIQTALESQQHRSLSSAIGQRDNTIPIGERKRDLGCSLTYL
jgi:hypothetical protein